jgi:four helix bundle protein
MPSMTKQKFDLEERTAKFGENTIEFAKQIPKNVITIPLINQLIKAATSIGSNYCEAECAETRKDFEHKLGICKKESKESKHWLRMIARAIPQLRDISRKLWKESDELQRIFIASIKKSKIKPRQDWKF